MDGTAAEDDVEDDTDVLSGTVETATTHRIIPRRHHTTHNIHIMGTSSTLIRIHRLSNSSFRSRRRNHNSSFYRRRSNSNSDIITPGGGGTRPAKGVDNPGTLRPGASPLRQ